MKTAHSFGRAATIHKFLQLYNYYYDNPVGKLVVSGWKILAPAFSFPRDVGLVKERKLSTIQQYLSINGRNHKTEKETLTFI